MKETRWTGGVSFGGEEGRGVGLKVNLCLLLVSRKVHLHSPSKLLSLAGGQRNIALPAKWGGEVSDNGDGLALAFAHEWSHVPEMMLLLLTHFSSSAHSHLLLT